MKIKRLISMIESLNKQELKYLLKCLQENISYDSFKNEAELILNYLQENPEELTKYMITNYSNLLNKIKDLLEEYFGEKIAFNFTWDGFSSWEIGDIDFYFVNSKKDSNYAASGNKKLKVCAVINGIGTENVKYRNLREVPKGKVASAFYLTLPDGKDIILVKEFLNQEEFSFRNLLEKIIDKLNLFIKNTSNRNKFDSLKKNTIDEKINSVFVNKIKNYRQSSYLFKENFKNLYEDLDITKYDEEIQSYIQNRDIHSIANLIRKGELEETKELLMIRDKEGWNRSVAHYLAKYSGKSGWSTNDFDILSLRDKLGTTVAHYLAENSEESGWSTNDKRVLMLKKGDEEKTVAHELAYYHPTWTTEDPEILNLTALNQFGVKITVRDILKKKKKYKGEKGVRKEKLENIDLEEGQIPEEIEFLKLMGSSFSHSFKVCIIQIVRRYYKGIEGSLKDQFNGESHFRKFIKNLIEGYKSNPNGFLAIGEVTYYVESANKEGEYELGGDSRKDKIKIVYNFSENVIELDPKERRDSDINYLLGDRDSDIFSDVYAEEKGEYYVPLEYSESIIEDFIKALREPLRFDPIKAYGRFYYIDNYSYNFY